METTETLRVARPDGAELAVEVIGAAAGGYVLLVPGAGCSMDWWRPEFCERIAERGFRVIRYDQRGTGRATPGRPGERLGGLPVAVDDAVAVLAAVADHDEREPRARWLGLSAGGWAAQIAALDHPALVESLTLVATRPASPFEPDADLPGATERLTARWADPLPEPDWADASAVVEYFVAQDRDYAGTEFDEAHERAIWEASVRRSPGMHHDEPEPDVELRAPRWRDRLGRLRVPTTVLHGTHDPLFPIANGEALARDIPGARFVPLDGVGHELPPRAWDAVVDAVTGARR